MSRRHDEQAEGKAALVRGPRKTAAQVGIQLMWMGVASGSKATQRPPHCHVVRGKVRSCGPAGDGGVTGVLPVHLRACHPIGAQVSSTFIQIAHVVKLLACCRHGSANLLHVTLWRSEALCQEFLDYCVAWDETEMNIASQEETESFLMSAK